MSIANALTPEEIRSAQASNPKIRERDLAAGLGISEGRFTAAWEGEGVTRLAPDLDAIFPRLEEIGELMALTRNEHAVHEKIGVYRNYSGRDHVAVVLGPVIDLRIFRAHWAHVFAVEKQDGDAIRRSIQFFDFHGDAVHKIHCRPSSDIDAWNRLVADLRLPAETPAPVFALREETPRLMLDHEPAVIGELRRRWASLKDGHEFQSVIAKLGLSRQQAVRALGEEYAWRIADDSLDEVLTQSAEGELPLMIFVRNPGCLQVHSGPVRNVKRMGDWINVMDRDFHLHLRTTAIAEAWVIRRPTGSGDVLSVEAYDNAGSRIILVNGMPCDSEASETRWTGLANALPRHSFCGNDMISNMRWLFRRERPKSLMLTAVCAAMMALLVGLHGTGARAAEGPQRVLSIGGAVTEIVYALGEESRLVGRDTTSTFPAAAKALPDVGYMRALAPESVLSIEPDLVLAREGSGPPEALDVLKAASVLFVEVPERFSAEGLDQAIATVAEALGVEAKGNELRASVAADMASLAQKTTSIEDRKRVLFVLSMQDGRILASGRGTAADGILALAGAENAITQLDGYKQLTDEALIAANPEAVLMMDRGEHFAVDDDALLSLPGMKTTQAAKDRAIIRMDGLYLLGFGPRTASAALDLAKALYGDDLR